VVTDVSEEQTVLMFRVEDAAVMPRLRMREAVPLFSYTSVRRGA
jgi:hypothetical protein